ncbi:MAG: cytochrome-c peroxidase [Anaerolineae bacterium]|nr:cytochrome-c peroxidase [Anaerolineae bacterium]
MVLGLALISLAGVILAYVVWSQAEWTPSGDDLAMLRSLSIDSLKPLPPDPSNSYADDPRAAALGQQLFFDTRFSANGQVACATCHKPELMFQDGTPLAHGVGTTNRRTMTLVGTAYSPWLFWDGRKDSLWAQALGPMESAVEHGGNRTQYAHLIAQYYRSSYEAIFGPLPALSQFPPSAGPVTDPAARAAWDALSPAAQETVSRVYANMGKSIAAYERKLQPGPSRFDAYVEAALKGDRQTMQAIFTADETAGLRLFIGKANCTQCHNGPLITDNHFHNTGVPAVPILPEDMGRATGAKQVTADEFNCLSRYSDAKPDACAELRYMVADGDELVRQFKPPSLRNVDGRGPFMHAGQFATLDEVLHHYSRAPQAPVGHSEIHPLNLSDTEIRQMIAFLKTLNGPLATDVRWLKPPA